MEPNSNLFIFNPKQCVLSKHGEVVPLNEKSLRLLALLLSDGNKIFSKHEILTHVWKERVVSEQVIFQNISHLRGLFGADAIKTFSKKGYQWQLAFTEHDEHIEIKVIEAQTTDPVEPPTSQDSASLATKEKSVNANKPVPKWLLRKKSALLMVCSAIVITIVLIFSHKPTQPFNTDNHVFIISDEFEAEKSITAVNEFNAQAVFDSPSVYWQSLSPKFIDNQPTTANSTRYVLLAKQLQVIPTGYALKFHIEGSYRGIDGYIFDDEIDGAHKQLEELLNSVIQRGFFSIADESSAFAKLLPSTKAYTEKLNSESILLTQFVTEYYLKKLSVERSQSPD